ncbi:hypothetical protein L226DRAFT_230742 [Lentinus tigrinus ALCF2SS1-7]|uniref:uncharacterized protein n=1 Tax=Lentinus tigrinus ALCF2SS1-7 TaxID=1328758 RepID=UPI001166122D|nr:hypothetical protein L226DRAFT_230742 [Lentinus tigrinus ALCF2SS1-7]
MMQNQLEASSYDARQLMRSASETASKWCLSQASQPLASCHQVLGMGDDQHALAQGHGDPEPLISTWAPDNHSQTEGLHQESMNEEDRMDICSDDIEADNHTKPPYAESVGVEESKTVPPASGEPQDASLVAAFSQLPDSQMPLAGLYSTTNQPPRPPGSLTGAFGGFRPRTYPPHMERWMRKCNLSAEISLSPPNEIRSQLPNFPSGPPPHLYQEVKGDQTSAVYLRPGPFYRSDRGREAMRACKNIKWPELESYPIQ